MRRGMPVFIAVALLAIPGAASAFSGTYAGDVVGDTNPADSLTFTARLHFAKKGARGKAVFTRVRNFDSVVQFSCFDSDGSQVSGSRRDDLAPGFLDGLRVKRKGRFGGTASTPTGLVYVATGRLRQSGKASGTLAITQGQRGSPGYCSTGTLADPTLHWTAIFHPNSCCAQPQPASTAPRG